MNDWFLVFLLRPRLTLPLASFPREVSLSMKTAVWLYQRQRSEWPRRLQADFMPQPLCSFRRQRICADTPSGSKLFRLDGCNKPWLYHRSLLLLRSHDQCPSLFPSLDRILRWKPAPRWKLATPPVQTLFCL